MEEAQEAERIIVMQGGLVAADKSPEELFSDAEFIKKLGLELPPAIELRDMLGMDKSVMTAAEIAGRI